jgi:hypothetical protein
MERHYSIGATTLAVLMAAHRAAGDAQRLNRPDLALANLVAPVLKIFDGYQTPHYTDMNVRGFHNDARGAATAQ